MKKLLMMFLLMGVSMNQLFAISKSLQGNIRLVNGCQYHLNQSVSNNGEDKDRIRIKSSNCRGTLDLGDKEVDARLIINDHNLSIAVPYSQLGYHPQRVMMVAALEKSGSNYKVKHTRDTPDKEFKVYYENTSVEISWGQITAK